MRDVKVFPVKVTKKENGSSTKTPGMTGWQTSILKRDEIKSPNYGALIPENVVMLDFDNDTAQPALEEKIGAKLPDGAIGQWSGRGPHYFFEVPPDVALRQGSNMLGIEGFDTRASGKGFVCTGEGYRLASVPLEELLAGPLTPLPVTLLELLKEPERNNVMPIRQDIATPDITDEDATRARDAITYLDASMSNDEWVRVGMALYSVPGGFEIWDEWSQRSDKYCPGEPARRWKSFQGTRIGLATLFYMAQQNGWPNPRKFFPENVLDDFSDVGGREASSKSKVNWFDYVFVAQENRVMRLSTGGMYTVPAFNAAMLGEDRRVPTANGKAKEVSAITYLMDYKRVAPVFYRMYMPSVGKFFEHMGEHCVNSYQPELVPEANEDWVFSGAWRIVEEHFHTLFEDPKDGELILDWMAHNVQFPGRKILWAPIIKGTQGDGKSTIRNILTLVMGHQNVRDITHSDLTSSFNAYAEGTCVAALEEIRVVGHSRFDVMNALKPLITNEIISVTRKGQDSIQVPNTQNYIGFTNHEDALPLDRDDRRYGIFYTKYETREQLWADRNKDYWETLHNAYRGGVGAIRGWLLDRDLSEFDRLFPPTNDSHKQRMIDSSRPIDDQMIIEAIEDLENFFTGKDVVREVRAGGGHVHVKRVGKVATEMGFTSHRIRVEDGERERIWVSSDVAQKNHDPAMLRHLVQAERVKKAGDQF